MLTVAHRGYSSAYPENTALAFEQAIAAGAEYIETDARLSRDGRIICSHDPDLKRIAGQALAIADLDLSDIKAIRLPQGQFVQTLEEVLAIARGRARVMLDVKITSGRMLEAILGALHATGMVEFAIYGVRTPEHMHAVARNCSRIALLAMPSTPDSAGDYAGPGVRAVRLWEDEVTAQRIACVRDTGREVWVTAGFRSRGEIAGFTTLERVTALIQAGVAAMLVNDPLLVRRAQSSPAHAS